MYGHVATRVRGIRKGGHHDTNSSELAASATHACDASLVSCCTAAGRHGGPFYNSGPLGELPIAAVALRGTLYLVFGATQACTSAQIHTRTSNRLKQNPSAKLPRVPTRRRAVYIYAKELAQSDLLPCLILGATSLQSIFGTTFLCGLDQLDARSESARFNEHRRQAACCV